MNGLDEIVARATSAIEGEYFQLPIYGGAPIYRERVYCYELYHQMRAIWPSREASPYFLNGEVDKRAHVAMEAVGVNGQKPDFLVHVPGEWSGNFALIEVKSAQSARDDPRKDLQTLALFRDGPRYERGIYLIYGEEADEQLVERICGASANVRGAKGVELWLHPQVGTPAFQTVAVL